VILDTFPPAIIERINTMAADGLRPVAITEAINTGDFRSTYNKVYQHLKKHDLINQIDRFYGGTVTQGVDDYHRGDHFWIKRIAFEMYFGNIPDGVRFRFETSTGAIINGRIALGRLFLDDGRYMKVQKGGAWKWGKIAR
jgi:hypothetical protein